jgi:hypothetical protein
LTDPALTNEASQYAASLEAATRRYSPEAKTEYGLTVAGYGRRVRALAEGKSSAEMVLVEHVQAAVAELGPDPAKGFNVVLDWLKRAGFLVAGLAIGQGVKVYAQNPILRGSVVWLLVLTVITVTMLVAAFVLDFPQVKRIFVRRRQ